MLGWDPVRKTIDAMPEWWDEKIKADLELAKFRDKNLEMYRMYYDQLFGDFVAVGERTQLTTDFQKNNDSPTNIQEKIGAEIGAANIKDNGDNDDFSLDLKEHYGLKATRNVSIEESLGIFLLILVHGCGNRLAQETFNHSGETIHRHFHKVLKAVLKLSGDIIRPNANYNEEVPP
ncbi:hypothetical protein Tco_0639950 [Tanacetum coccineum]